MNMKKTIAAVSAATVAMSAVAATVSAEETASTTEAKGTSITYDLVRETRTIDDGTATFNSAATGIDLTGATALTIKVMQNDLKWEETQFTITVRNGADGSVSPKTFKLCANAEKENYSSYAQYITSTGAVTTDKALAEGVLITIPVSPFSTDGLSTASFNAKTLVDVVATSKHPLTTDALKNLNKDVMTSTAFNAAGAVQLGEDLYTDVQYAVVSPAASGVEAAITAAKTTLDAAVLANTTAKNTQPAIIAKAGIDTNTVAAISAKTNVTYVGSTIAAAGVVFPAATTYADVSAIAALTITAPATTVAVPAGFVAGGTSLAAADTITQSVINDAKTLKALFDANGAPATITALNTALASTGATATTALTTAATNEATALTAYNAALTSYQTFYAKDAFKFSSVTNAGEKVHLYPMITTINGVAMPDANGIYTTIGNSTGSLYNKNDLIDYLEINNFNADKPAQALLGSKVGKVGYVNVLPVLNDIIANNKNVTFSFKTSALYVKTDVDAKTNNEYGEGFTEVKDKFWYHPTFNQHLYDTNGYYGRENSGYVGTSSNWAFNLFSGGLVINSKYTMALNDTATFDWGESTLSFDWEDITKDKVTNANMLLEYMNLYTSTDWFWDSMTVTYSNEDGEDVEDGAGETAAEETVAEEETAAEEETVAEETEASVEETTAAADTAANPTTGNAPIALAVIPVALAAAAIVAKKRG